MHGNPRLVLASGQVDHQNRFDDGITCRNAMESRVILAGLKSAAETVR